MVDISPLVLQALAKIKDGCVRNHIKSGIIDNISGTMFFVKRIRKHGEPKTIGFFGAQKRGKSSLINQLLRCNLMPVSPIPMSSVVIKVKHEQSHEQGRFTIDVFDSNGNMDSSQVVDLNSARLLLTQYGSHKGSMSNKVDTISVTSNFSDSKLLENEGILVDTPGAEVAFNSGEATKSNEEDAQRAINILSSTHIVIFVERADQMESKNSKSFFTNHLKPMRPLCVINWKDAYNLDAKYKISDPLEAEAKRQSCMRETMLKTYGMNFDRILCVSSKEAAQARANGNNELLTKSNLPVLENRILEELRNLDPERGLSTCLLELKKNLSQLHDETAKEIFMQAQRPFFVILHTPGIKSKITEIARAIYEQYC